MPARSARFLALAVVALAAAGRPAAPYTGGAAAVEKKDIVLTLKITDKANGLSLEAKKSVAKDSNAFDAVRHTVTMAYRTDSEGGPVVTSLCGVAPLKGYAWTCYFDGKRCKTIGKTTLNADAVIEWKAE
jgi:hypothetical protein